MPSERRPPVRLLLPCIALALLAVAQRGRAQSDDLALKAAYLYNIVQFTTWPGPAVTRPLNVCLSSAHALWDNLRKLQGKPVGERRLAVLEPGADTACDVDVVRAGAARPADPVSGSGILTVVDEPNNGYAGAVALIEEDQRLRFDIDTREAARAGLRFSSRLLRLARNVR